MIPPRPNEPRRILFVAMHNSVHLLRWIRMISGGDLVVLVFPVYVMETPVPDDVRQIQLADVETSLPPGLWCLPPSAITDASAVARDLAHGYVPWNHSFLEGVPLASPATLQHCIDRFRPHLVHSMEIQLAGYLCREVARRMEREFPPWLLSNWGSDLALFRKLPSHQERLADVCSRCDFYLAECDRDRPVARSFGYHGPDLPTLPASGGADVPDLVARSPEPPSKRRTIVVKGYHGWSGRALLSLSALELAREALAGFTIVVPLASDPVVHAAKGLRERGIHVVLEPYVSSHADAIRRLASARIVVGMGISDGISTTLLEAMAVGAFPIQSSSACAEEWIECGRTGYVVSPHDTRALAHRLAHAASDDDLVDSAAATNRRTVARRWDRATNAKIARSIYDQVIAGRRSSG